MLLDAVARHNLGKERMDKEVVEKVSRVYMKSIPISVSKLIALFFDLLL